MSSGFTRPLRSTDTVVTRAPNRAMKRQGSTTDGCSTVVVITCGVGDDAPSTVPLMAWLLASLPPLVSSTSSASHCSKDAISRRAVSTASRAGWPAQCPLDGFPKWLSSKGRMTAATSGAIGVLALKSR